MKAQANRMLQDTKGRAFHQIQSALHRLQREGNSGIPFSWWDADYRQHDTTAHYQGFYHFQLGVRQGVADMPLFYNSDLHAWDSVLNMPVDDLCMCADGFVHDFQNRKLNTRRQ